MRRPNSARRDVSASSSLEHLELRRLLATALWDGGGGDESWHNPLNWNRNGADVVPQDGDDVAINAGNGVVYSAGSVSLASLITSRSLTVSGGTLGVTGAFNVNAALFAYSGGVLNAGPTLTSSTLELSGGTSAVPFVVRGATTLAGVVRSGQSVWVQGGGAGHATLFTAEGAANEGVIRLESISNNWTSRIVTHGSGFTNRASGSIVAFAGSAGARSIEGLFINQGVVDSAANTVLVITGTYHADGGAAFGSYFLIDSSIHIISAPSKLSTIILGGNNTLATDLLPGYELWVRGGVGGHAALFTAEGVANHGVIRLESSFNNWTSRIVANTPFVNAADGTINARRGSTGDRRIEGVLVNRGVIDAAADTLLVITGEYHADAGTAVGSYFLIDSSIHIISAPSKLSTIILGGNNTLATDLLPGYELWVRGGVGGHAALFTAEGVANHGVIRLESSFNNWTSRIVANTAFVNAADGTINARRGSTGDRRIEGVMVNQGVIDAAADTLLVITGEYHAAAGVANGSYFLIDSSIHIISAPSKLSTIILGGNNTLATDLLPGYELWVRGGVGGHAALFTAEGVANHGVIRLESSFNNWTSRLVTHESGFTNGADGSIEPRIGSGGDRVISGRLINDGTILIPVAMVLRIEGVLTQGESGVLHFIVDQPGVAGRINVKGLAELGGTLRMSFLNSFTPICSQTFTFLAATTLVGEFDAVSTPAPPQGLQFVDLYTSNQVRIVASSIADINRDGVTNSDDFFTYLVGFFNEDGDFNGDGVTNTQDFFAFLDAFFNAC